MSNEVNNSVFRALSKHFRVTGFALLAFLGALLTIRFEHEVEELDLYILIISISIVLLIIGSAVCLILDSRNEQ